MKTKIIGILIAILTIFIILIVFILCTSIKIHSVCQLYISNYETVLFVSDQNVYKTVKNYEYFDLTNITNNEEIRFYAKKNSLVTNANLIFLQNNKEYSYNNGWYEVLLFVNSETFSKHYLNL